MIKLILNAFAKLRKFLAKFHTRVPGSLHGLISLSLRLQLCSLKPTTQATARHIHTMLMRACTDCKITQINSAYIYNLLASLRQLGYKDSTIKQLLSCLNRALELACSLNILAANPLKSIKLPLRAKSPKSPRCAHLSDIKRLLTHAKGELKTFLHLAFFTGARAGEILALKRSDISYTSNILEISRNATRYGLSTPKSGQSRTILLPKALKEHLKNQRFNGFSKNYFQIYYEFNKLSKRLGLPYRGLHFIRHTYASYCVRANLPLTSVSKMLGHSDTSMLTRTYLHHLSNPNELKMLNNLYSKR